MLSALRQNRAVDKTGVPPCSLYVVRSRRMPEVSRFFGIMIRMYFDEHNPPHFHAIYAGNEAQIGIEPITILEGALPSRAASMSRGFHGN